jgi:lipid-A-disaccharide synthase
MKRILLLAGEASGDLHGAILARALLAQRSDLELWGVGGEQMEAAGVRLLLRSEQLAVVGLLEVLRRAPRVLGALATVRRFLREARPDLFVPIDFPDFNFRLLRTAHRHGVPIVYYISPQIWAWRGGRIRTIQRYVRRMVVIFPFEEELYRRAAVPVRWVGHPLVDRIPPARTPEEERSSLGHGVTGPVVALLPGSRESEVRRMGPLLCAVRERVDALRRTAGAPPVHWLVGRAPGLKEDLLRVLAPSGFSAEHVLPGVEAMRAADLSLAASGTVTLEAALLGRPIIVFYCVNALTYAIARRLVRVDHIAMANLLAGERVVPEFVQRAATPAALAAETQRLLEDPQARAVMRAGLMRARASLGPPGAGQRAASAIVEVLEGT